MAATEPSTLRRRRTAQTPRQRKLGELVAERIVAEIRTRGWPVGEMIGTEAELIARFGVSRATLLEAVRQLERHGVAVMRRGGRGGLVVSNPASRSVARVLSTYIELTDISLSEQFEAARILEAHAARLAAEHSSEAAIAELREFGRGAVNAASYLELSRLGLGISNAIADAAGNPAISLFIRALVRARSDHFQAENRRDRPINRAMQDFAQNLFNLVEAIAAGDAAGAEQRLRSQREGLERASEQRYARLAARASPLVAAARRRQVAHERERGAEVVAFMIRDDIVRLGWPVGRRLGEEADLPAHYGVSRWVFRQAVRILEPHGIVEMKRGQGGGMIIGEPDPYYTVRAAIGYLDYERLPRRLALDAWSAMLETSAQLAAERSAGKDADLLAQAGPAPPDSAFYARVFKLTENRVLDLYGRVLTAFVLGDGEFVAGPARDDDRAAVAEAVIAGDGPLARRRMRRHLQKVCGPRSMAAVR